jgi:hypothetical protein
MFSKPRMQKPIIASLAAALFLALALTVGGGPAVAEQNQPDAIAPVEEFSKQVEEFKKSYPDLNKRIEESAKSIDAITDVETAQKEIEALRAAVSGMLGSVADNGPVSQLGAKALAHAQAKIKELQQGSRFTKDESDFLLDQWRKLASETERATDELGFCPGAVGDPPRDRGARRDAQAYPGHPRRFEQAEEPDRRDQGARGLSGCRTIAGRGGAWEDGSPAAAWLRLGYWPASRR